MSSDGRSVKEIIRDTGVWQEGHTVLPSGKHTDVQLDFRRLSGEPSRLVLAAVKDTLRALQLRVVLPIPDKAAAILTPWIYPPEFYVARAQKAADRTFAISWADAPMVRSAGRMAIFDDTVQSGETAVAAAEAVRWVNPDVELHLIALWRRAEPQIPLRDYFDSQSYFIDDIVTSDAQDCACGR